MGILLLVFFLSGVCALAYQVIWIRLFGLVFGGTVLSMSVVVAVFMGGLALGSHVIGCYAEKVGNRVRLYGILEIVLGVVATLVLFGIDHLAGFIYVLPFSTDIHSFSGIAVRIIVSGVLLIVPTMIMGGTLPILVRAVTDDKNRIIVNTSLLYAVNTMGAMIGACAVGFLFIRVFGVSMTNHMAATINILMGVVAILISGRFESSPDTAESGRDTGKSLSDDKGMRFIVTLGITGFAGLTLEMVWLRMMLLTFNNTIYLYTIVLTVYLFGLALGGMLLRVIVPRKHQTEGTFGLILGLTGIAVLVGFLTFPWTTYKAFLTNFNYYSTFPRLSILTAVVFAILGFVPVLLMGLSFPLGLGMYGHDVRGLSRRIGFIYAVNTAGSLAGSLAAVFILIPTIGMKGTVIFCSLLFLAPSMWFLVRNRRSTYRLYTVAGTAAVSFVLLIMSARADIPASILARRLLSTEHIEYLKEGSSSTIWISSGKPFRKIWMDNLWISSTSNEGTHALLAHYPLLCHPNPKSVCGIAFGTGQTFGTCLLYPIESIVSVEIDNEVIEACRGRFTRENYGILEDPRNTIVIDDGRFFLAGTDKKFDIITAEPLQPYTRGTVSLYSYEFYQACVDALNPDGVVAQWLPVYNSGVDDIWRMIRTFVEVFDHAVLFLNANDGILLGSNSEMHLDATRELTPMARADLDRVFNGSIYALAGNYICSRDALLKASAGYSIITDDRPSLEYTAPISHWNEDVTAEVEMRRRFLALTEPLDTLFRGDVDWEQARTYHKSRELINRAFYTERSGSIVEAHRLYEEALRSNPDDMRAKRELYFFLRRSNRVKELAPDLRSYFTRELSGES